MIHRNTRLAVWCALALATAWGCHYPADGRNGSSPDHPTGDHPTGPFAGARTVRVLLTGAGSGGRVEFEPRGGRLTARSANGLAVEAEPGGEIAVEASGAGLLVNGKPAGSGAIRVECSPTAAIGVRGARESAGYAGVMECRPAPGGGGLVVVNHVPMEEYVAGVVGREMVLSWGEEALKAQAVAARTYAVYEIDRAAREPRTDGFGAFFDVYDSTRSQVYGGVDLREGGRAGRVAAATRGEMLGYRAPGGASAAVFKTYFHSTCGGHTASVAAIFGEDEIPPLAGVVCGQCGASPKCRWTAVKSAAEVRALLGGAAVKAIRLDDGESPGHAARLAVVPMAGGAPARMSSQEARRRLGLYSGFFRVSASPANEGGAPSEFTFTGQGFGHGVGLCQWGARGLAEQGRGYREMLAWYYPGASLLRGAPAD